MKKIVFVIKSLQGNGAERFVLTLAKAMHAYDNAECHVICFDDICEYEIESALQLHVLKINNNFSYKKNCKLLDGYILKNIGKPDLILSNLTYADKIMRHSQLDSVYHIIHCHTSIEHYQHKNIISRWLAKLKLSILYRKKPSVCVSKGVLNDFMENIKPKRSSCVIYNPIDVCGIQKSALASSEVKLPNKYILHVGKFKEAKRHDRLLRAYALAKPDYDLVLLGKGHTMAENKKLAAELGVADKVHFLGHVNNPYPIMKQAALFVLSSDFEGLSYVLLESISLKVTTISVDCPSGPREVFGDKYAHCLADLSDKALAMKINDALADPNKYIPELNEQFSMKWAVLEYMKLVERK